MSLIEAMMVPCLRYEQSAAADGVLGRAGGWHPTVPFKATIIKNAMNEEQRAEQPAVKETFTIVVQKGFRLTYKDVFQRQSDGQLFIVTGNSLDSEAPEASTIQIGKVTAERWELPDA